MSDINGPGDDLILPFIFVPHGGPAPPELEEYKARYPGWFTIPATFEPHEDAGPRDEAPPGSPPDPPPQAGKASEPPNHARRLGGNDLITASWAFQRANAVHGDPVAALRAMRDSPETFADGASSAREEGADGGRDAGIDTPSAGPRDNVRISPEGEVWSQGSDGLWANHGPASDYTGSGEPSGRKGTDRNRR